MQELAVNRSLVFTGPQDIINRLDFATLNGTLKMTDYWSLQTVLYYRNHAQTASNGNTTAYAACTDTPGILCQPDGITPLANAAGRTLPDLSAAGTVPIGENDRESIHAWGRGATLQITSKGPIQGRDNQFALGAAVDYAATGFFTSAQIGVIGPQLTVLPSDLVVDTPENSTAAVRNGDAVPVSVDSVEPEPRRLPDRYLQRHARHCGDRERPLQHRAHRPAGPAGPQSHRLQSLRPFQPGDRGDVQGTRSRDALWRPLHEHPHADRERDRVFESARTVPVADESQPAIRRTCAR